MAPALVRRIVDIPFLPIRFFKSHKITTGEFEPELVFASSGTTGNTTSRHFVYRSRVYRESFLAGFNQFYGNSSRYCILGLLPSYLERGDSSLVFMVDELIRRSDHPQSGFYLNETRQLADLLVQLESMRQPTLLIGVTFALLDFADAHPMRLDSTIVMETGGMKGRRRELTREEVHAVLKARWQLPRIHSEYGMTELLSQAYAKEEGRFHCPPWMRVLRRDEDDPLSVHEDGEGLSGAINVIDLANLYSCSFIATEDLGRWHADGGFEVLGRMDNSDIRGCSMLYRPD